METLPSTHPVHPGHDDGFSLLVHQHMEGVFRVAMGFVHQQQDAEDIAQEVFVKAWQGLSGFDERSTLRTWLYRIAIHESLNFLKKKKRRRQWEKWVTLFGGETVSAPDPDRLLRQEEQLLIKEVLDQLSDKQKQAFVLREYEDLSQRQIAEIMGLSEGAVEQLLIRARNHLQKQRKKFSADP